MSGVQTKTVADGDDGVRLDRWFKQHVPDLPFGRLQKLLRTGQVRVDGKRAKADTRVEAGAEIRIPPYQAGDKTAKPKHRVNDKDAEMIRSLILYQDDWVIAINKPPGLAVQGGSRTARHIDGMLDALQFKAPERPRLVHRLDKDTSGVLLLARTRKAAQVLTKAFTSKDIRKIYWALAVGNPEMDEGEISSLLSKQGGAKGERMESGDGGQKAVTDFVRVDHAGTRASWLALMPRTGRTHQLRVHCINLGTPIVGDGKYGGPEAYIEGLSKDMHLHARQLVMPHPRGSGTLDITAPLPDHMQKSWSFFEFDERDALDMFGDE